MAQNTQNTPRRCVLGVLQKGNGGADAEDIEHAQTDVFDVFGVSGWVFEGGRKVEEAGGVGLGHGWMGGRGAERARLGTFYVFEGRGWSGNVPNAYNMPVWACCTCLGEGGKPDT